MDKDKFVELLMSIPQNKIKKNFLTAEMQNYIELEDFPVKGTKVKIRILNFESGRKTFRISKAQDNYSGSFWTRGYQYNKTWDNLPNHEKGDVFKNLIPITKAIVNFSDTDYGFKRVAEFQDVFVLEYFTVPPTKPDYEKFKNIEIILFQFKKKSQLSALVESVTTP